MRHHHGPKSMGERRLRRGPLARQMLMLCLTVCAGACGDEERSEPREPQVQTEDALRRRLTAYALPASDDFAAIPQDPNNPLTAEKVRLGRLLFHDPGLLANPRAEAGRASGSCATCHHASAGFQAGAQQGIGDGGIDFGQDRRARPGLADEQLDVQAIRTPSAMNAAWFENVLWNGQFGATGINRGTSDLWTEDTPKAVNHLGFHGLETQAIAGLDVHRLTVDAAGLHSIPRYVELFAAAFPDRAPADRINRTQAGLAIAAYERTLLANRAPFQRWLRGEATLSTRQLDGVRLFFGRAQCAACHDNPGLGGMSFHALGMADMPGELPKVAPDAPEHRGRAGFTGSPADAFTFKTPQLYNLQDSPFFGHGGTFNTVRQVIEYKNRGVAQNPAVRSDQLSPHFKPLGLSVEEIDALTDFIENALYDPDLARYEPAPVELPTGACVPNNDVLSRQALGCAEQPPALPVGLGGLELIEAETAELAWIFPEVFLAPGGVLVIAPDADQAAFEARWGPLPLGAIFASASSEAGEALTMQIGARFALKDPDGGRIDGPGAAVSAQAVMHREPDGRWRERPTDSASPGEVPSGFDGQGLIMTEILGEAGAPGFDFIEIGFFP